MAVNAYEKFEAKSPVTSLLAGLDQTSAGLDNIEAAKKRQARTGLYILLAGLILSVIDAVVFPPLLFVSLPAVVAGLSWWVYSSLKRDTLAGQRKRLQIAKERLLMIQSDAGQEKPFHLQLALRAAPVRRSEEAWHGRKNGKQQLLEESWFSLEGPLLDGVILSDEIKELTRKRTFSNARGKRKTKSRVTYLVSVRFSYPASRYGDARLAQQALKEEAKVGPAATLRSVRVTEKAIALKAMVSSDQEIARTAGMLSMGGYRILNLARRMATAQRGKAS